MAIVHCFQDFRDSSKEDEVTHNFTALLTKVNYCINLLEVLESERNFKNFISDWAVGQRKSLNILRTS